MKTDFKGGEEAKDIYDLNLYFTILEHRKSVFGFKKSDVRFKEFDSLCRPESVVASPYENSFMIISERSGPECEDSPFDFIKISY